MLLRCISPVLLLLHAVAAIDQYCTPYQSLAKRDDEGCPSTHVVGVRGTTEEPGPGAQAVLIDQILGNLSNADACGIVYPADGIVKDPPSVSFPTYKASEQMGVEALSAHLINYAETCPDTDVVLMGYSQGAHVVGDVLCGRSWPTLFKFPQPPLDHIYTYRVVAVIQFGDPTDRANPPPPWHVGTSTTGGFFPRNAFSGCRYLTPDWQSYCDKGDPFCALGKDMKVHLSYLKTYGAEAVQFILERVSRSGTPFTIQVPKNGAEL